MVSEAPPFWWEKPDWRAWSLYPLSWSYGAIAARRMVTAKRVPIDLPVICVGNFTVGGTGKTPVSIALAKEATRQGLKPGFLSRGHGGSFGQPHLVDLGHDSAKHVGDEPLLLARHGLVAVTPDRVEGARLLLRHGCDILIMDDGFQSARIRIDYALVVVDARFGLGNGHVIPAGPLRAPLIQQMRFADGVLRMGQGDAAERTIRLASRAGKAVFDASIAPEEDPGLHGRRFLAFAGIGHPEKFFDTVRAAGGTVEREKPFPDHHFYGSEDIENLWKIAREEGLQLITTAKDAVRLNHEVAPREFLENLTVLDVEARFDDPQTPARIVAYAREAWRRRR
jgi:tetraacyldisaccharide 4'-kinase